jgi:hypothetical protein
MTAPKPSPCCPNCGPLAKRLDDVEHNLNQLTSFAARFARIISPAAAEPEPGNVVHVQFPQQAS